MVRDSLREHSENRSHDMIADLLLFVSQARYCVEIGISKDLAAWLYSSIGLASLVARVPGAKLCEVITSVRVYILAVTTSALSSTLLPFATNWIGILCFSLSYGVADGLMAIGFIISVMENLTTEQKAQGFGFSQLFIGVASLGGPPLGGKFVSSFCREMLRDGLCLIEGFLFQISIAIIGIHKTFFRSKTLLNGKYPGNEVD